MQTGTQFSRLIGRPGSLKKVGLYNPLFFIPRSLSQSLYLTLRLQCYNLSAVMRV